MPVAPAWTALWTPRSRTPVQKLQFVRDEADTLAMEPPSKLLSFQSIVGHHPQQPTAQAKPQQGCQACEQKPQVATRQLLKILHVPDNFALSVTIASVHIGAWLVHDCITVSKLACWHSGPSPNTMHMKETRFTLIWHGLSHYLGSQYRKTHPSQFHQSFISASCSRAHLTSSS